MKSFSMLKFSHNPTTWALAHLLPLCYSGQAVDEEYTQKRLFEAALKKD